VRSPEPRALAQRRFAASMREPIVFFEANAARVALASRDLAKAFAAGHRLLAYGSGAQRSDALHVSVEFVHPVIVGKRALPAIALEDDFARQLEAIGEPGDVALAIVGSHDDPAARAALQVARRRGLVCIALVAGRAADWSADHVFAVESADPYVVQEVHETLYHVLWEQVHVFLEHAGMLT